MANLYFISKFRKGGGFMNALSQRLAQNDIESLAEDKLYSYGFDTLPVDPLVITAIEGIEVYDADFHNPGVSGLITKNGKEICIYVNSSDAPTRKRFTIAHELGHYFLHLQNEDGNFVDSINLFRNSDSLRSEDASREVEANRFAAALLMPRDHVLQEWRKSKSVEFMAMHFDVSPTAMEFRLKNLRLIHG
jgi:Zn-dependent peptidase ImmA (M78 family)